MPSPWEQRADYINACNWEAPPGVPRVYNPPRPVGRESPTDVTDYHYGQSFWTENDLPEITYMLNPDDDWREFQSSPPPVPYMTDPITGKAIFERWPRPGEVPRMLLDFPILRGIDKIGTEESFWWFEVIRRLDPRITYRDLLMRMECTGLKRICDDKSFIGRRFTNYAAYTMRPAWCMLNWHSKLQGSAKLEVKFLETLSASQVQNNTTRGLTPGLTDPSKPEGKHNPRVPLPVLKGENHKRVPLRTFNADLAKQQQVAVNAKSPPTAATYPLNTSNRLFSTSPSGPMGPPGSLFAPILPKPKRKKTWLTDPSDNDTVEEDSILSNQSAQGLPQKQWTFIHENPAYQHVSKPVVNTTYSMTTRQSSNTTPREPPTQPQAPWPLPPAAEPEPTPRPRRLGVDYHETQITRQLSPSACRACGLHDPQALHVVNRCPTLEPPSKDHPQRPSALVVDDDDDDADGDDRFPDMSTDDEDPEYIPEGGLIDYSLLPYLQHQHESAQGQIPMSTAPDFQSRRRRGRWSDEDEDE